MDESEDDLTETGRWINRVEPPHRCYPPDPELDEIPFWWGSEWACDCGKHWIWSNGGGWLPPEEYRRRHAENEAQGIPNEPTNPHAHPFFRLPQ